MLENDHIPVLTDLIEKGIKTRLSEPELDHNEDLILEEDDREEPKIGASQFETETETETETESDPAPARNVFTNDPALDQIIRRILNEHMELALQDIKLAISNAREDKRKDY
jgi:hypothetical protein